MAAQMTLRNIIVRNGQGNFAALMSQSITQSGFLNTIDREYRMTEIMKFGHHVDVAKVVFGLVSPQNNNVVHWQDAKI